MLDWLTPAERRGASVLVIALLLGAARDACRVQEVRRGTQALISQGRTAGGSFGDSAAPARERSSSDRRGVLVPRPAVQDDARYDLNLASVQDLDRLPGIGPVLARRIVEYRLQHGPFRRPDELLAVRGIGPRLFSRIERLVSVGEPRTGSNMHQVSPLVPGRSVHSAQSGPRRRADSTSVGTSPSR